MNMVPIPPIKGTRKQLLNKPQPVHTPPRKSLIPEASTFAGRRTATAWASRIAAGDSSPW